MGLPVIQPRQQIRASRSTRWRIVVLTLAHLIAAAHITHWLIQGRSMTPVEPSEAAAFANAGIVNAGLIFFAASLLLTMLFGRFFCGWACHLVALQDLSRGLLEKFGRRPKPLRSRLLAWVPMIAFLYAFIWPAVRRFWFTRSLAPTHFEFTTSEFWATFPGWVVAILTFLICGFVAIYFLGAKGFCTYACPYGAAFGVAERLSPMRIRVTDACEGCGHCTAVCTSNVRVHEEVRDFGMVVDDGCMKCLDCVSVCPNDALYYGFGRLPVAAKARADGRKMRRFPLSWSEEGVLAVAFACGFFAFNGLYGYVPFLLALGLAGVLAYWVLLLFQLWRRDNLSLKGWALKRGGELRPAGKRLLMAAVLLAGLWAHSGTVRFLAARGEQAVLASAAWQGGIFDLQQPRRTLPAELGLRLERGVAAYTRANALGFVETLGAAPRLAALQYLLGRDAAAAGSARDAIARDELAGRMHQLLGRLAFERGDLASAAASFERAIEAAPFDSRPLVSLGIVAAQRGDFTAARNAFSRSLRVFGESAELAYNLALVEAYDGQLEEAAAGFARALELEPGRLAARENLAGTLAALGRLEESAEQYSRAIEQAPRDAVTRVLLARVLLMAGRRAEAREQVEAALEIDPTFEEARALRGQLGSG